MVAPGGSGLGSLNDTVNVALEITDREIQLSNRNLERHGNFGIGLQYATHVQQKTRVYGVG